MLCIYVCVCVNERNSKRERKRKTDVGNEKKEVSTLIPQPELRSTSHIMNMTY